MTKKVLFLINPVSGIGKQKTIEKYIDSELDKKIIEADISYTCYKAHARELAAGAVGKYDAVVAVGGDGTVNEVASRLVGTDTALAIIPTGSGNGLARFLKIPLRVRRAVQSLNDFRIKKIDTLKVNQFCCVNVAGIGFDAHISHQFEGKKMRGPLGYLQLITSEFSNYKPDYYHLNIDGHIYKRRAFLISFANSSQYGNNIHIAPEAKIDDGLIDVSIVHEFPKFEIPTLLLSLLDKSIHKHDKNEVLLAKKIVVDHDGDILAHIDGEPVNLGGMAEVHILPLSLNVVVPTQQMEEKSIFEPLKDIIPNLKEGMSLDQIWKIKKGNKIVSLFKVFIDFYFFLLVCTCCCCFAISSIRAWKPDFFLGFF